jgi:geranylgeranyl pyrophosphate synthase
VTLPLILARRLDAELAELDLRTIDSAEEAAVVCDRIAGTDAMVETRRRARQLVEDAKEHLDGRLPVEVTALLELVADRVVDRYS